MKKLQILALLVLSVGSMRASDKATQDYQGTLQNALNLRAAGDTGYESGSENMRKIRNPRRVEVGQEQEASEYIGVKQNMPGFVAASPIDRFVEKVQEKLDKVKSGEMTPDELAQDGAMIAQYKPEGARLLAEASDSLPNKPISYGIDIQEGQDAVIRVSTLNDNVGRLHFIGDDFVSFGDGFAFPVSAQ